MIVCLECGHHNDERSEFCASCGVFLEWEGQQQREGTAPRPDHDTGEIGAEPPAASCPRCGEPNLAGLNWCSRCGLALTGPPADVPPSRPRRAQRVAVVQPWWRSTAFVIGALVAVIAAIGAVVFSMGSGEPEAQRPIITDAATTTATSEPAVAASPAPSAPPPPPVESRLTAAGVTASSVLAPDDGVTYEPLLTLDGNPVTAWNDGVDGDPAGQWLEYTFAAPVRVSRIEVVNGYDKVVGDLDLFEANARIRGLRVETDGGTTTGELTDTREPQSLDGPFGPSCRYRIVIDSVYPGAEFEDVALSEIAFFGTQDLQATCAG